MKNKNLEAENEVFKGMFRTPFAFLIGGPVGVIANTIYTSIKAKEEITQNELHKNFVSSQFQKVQKLDEYLEEKKNNSLSDTLRWKSLIDYLSNEFDNSEDISFNDGSSIVFCTKDKLPKRKNHYRVIIRYGNDIFNSFGADYLPENEFVEKYKEDKKNNKICNMYKMYNNNINMTFCYQAGSNYYCTGMHIEK